MLAAVLSLASTAHATALGTTIGIGSGGGTTAGGFLPSFDIYADPVTVNVHALELLQSVSDDDLFLGANVYFNAVDRERGELKLVLQPGFGLDFFTDPTVDVITAEARIGARTKGGPAGMGVWIVPAVGFATSDNDTDFITAGTLQIGAFFGV
jgi:hypothetical protein